MAARPIPNPAIPCSVLCKMRELDFCGLQIGSDVQRRVENSLWSELIRETHRAAEDTAE